MAEMTEYLFSARVLRTRWQRVGLLPKFSSAFLPSERQHSRVFRGRNCEQVTGEGLVTFFCFPDNRR